MKLNAEKRTSQKKGDVNALRRAGKIPAVIYSKAGQGELVVIDTGEFKASLREIKQGRLSTTVFTLKTSGEEKRVVVKDIQYHPTTYNILHLDFQELVKDMPVSVKVPISCVGVVDCVGVKLGGFLRQVIRSVKVECLPHQLPSEFVVDVRDLSIKQTKRLSDLEMPKGVKPLASMDEVVVVIAKR